MWPVQAVFVEIPLGRVDDVGRRGGTSLHGGATAVAGSGRYVGLVPAAHEGDDVVPRGARHGEAVKEHECGRIGGHPVSFPPPAPPQATLGATIIPVMQIETWWPLITERSRAWLIAHNGEPLDPSVSRDIFEVTDQDADPSWWAGESTDGLAELTDAAIDWIETAANGEDPAG